MFFLGESSMLKVRTGRRCVGDWSLFFEDSLYMNVLHVIVLGAVVVDQIQNSRCLMISTFSSVHFLRWISVCIVVLPDINHRTWNDTQLALKDSNMWFWVLVITAILNLDHGPWDSQRWWNVLQEGAAEYSKMAKHSCPLIRSEHPHLDQEKQLATAACDEEWSCEGDGNDEDVFIRLQDSARAKFPKVAMSRWFQVILCARRLIAEWTLRYLILTYMYIAQGGKQLEHAAGIAQTAKVAFKTYHETEDVAKADTKGDQEEIKKIKSKCFNTCEFVHSQLANRDLWARAVCVTRVCMHAERFQSEHGNKNRSASESAEWWTERAADLGLGHVDQLLGELDDPSTLQHMGCHVEGCSDYWTGLDASHPFVMKENAMAGWLGDLTIALAARRIKSLLACYAGYPAIVAGLYNEDEKVVEKCAMTILRHGKLWETLKDKTKLKGAFWDKLRARSPFRHMHTVQIHGLLLKSEGVVTKDLASLAWDQFSGLTHTEFVEDCFRELRKTESGKNFNKKMSDVRCFHALIKSKVEDVRHRFKKVAWEVFVLPKKLAKGKTPVGMFTLERSKAPAFSERVL